MNEKIKSTSIDNDSVKCWNMKVSNGFREVVNILNVVGYPLLR